MTRASAANATALPQFTALTSAIAASSAAFDISPIEAAYPDWLAKERRRDEAAAAVSALEENYEEPDRPLWHPAREEGGYRTLVGDRPGRFLTCIDDREENVTWLRERIAKKPFNEWDHVTLGHAASRAQATLDKILAWRAEKDRRREALGLPAAEAHAQQVRDLARAARRAILEITPATFREAAFQAAVIDANWDASEASRLLSHLLRLADIPSYHADDEEG